MLDHDVTILMIDELPTYDELSKPISVVRVRFKVGDRGPFWERFAKDAYNLQARDQRLNDFAREVR